MPPAVEVEPFGSQEFATVSGVSRETLARLKTYAGMLEDWNSRHNLISRASLSDLWRRHFWDSAQLVSMLPTEATTLVDLGSGAGFPGLVLAELLRERTGLRVVLVEATAKKCRFLEAAAQRLSLAVDIRHGRIEEQPMEPFDAVTARACAPLSELLAYAQRFFGPTTHGFFHKGQNLAAELTQASKSWRIK